MRVCEPISYAERPDVSVGEGLRVNHQLPPRHFNKYSAAQPDTSFLPCELPFSRLLSGLR
jgi:hypothetical protein